MSIYTSRDGLDEVRGFATGLLDRWAVPHDREVRATPLGPTHVLAAGEGPPLVVVFGTNFCAATSLDLVELLAASHRVHAVDLPGQPGLSHDERPRGRPWGAWMAGLVARITDEPPVVVGHSLGARIVLAGLAAGAEAHGSVLVDPAGLVRLSVTPRVMRPTMPWLRRPDDDTSAGLLEMMLAPGHHPSRELVEWMTLVGRHVRSSLAPPPLPRRDLRGIDSTRTTIVTGRHDLFLPPARLERAAARALPEAGFEVVEDAGHLLPHERPDSIVAAVHGR